MPAGRPRKPYKLRALEGGRGHHRPVTPDLPAPAEPLVAPSGLSAPEKAAWKVHVGWLRALKLESKVDGAQLEGLVRMLCRARRADAAIARHGLTMVTKSNGTIQRPEVAISAACWKSYSALAGQFGLSPAA